LVVGGQLRASQFSVLFFSPLFCIFFALLTFPFFIVFPFFLFFFPFFRFSCPYFPFLSSSLTFHAAAHKFSKLFITFHPLHKEPPLPLGKQPAWSPAPDCSL
jgi:hypothetical protein